MTGAMLDHALAYAARGWPVFPCNPVPDPVDIDPKQRKAKSPLVPGADRDEGGQKIPKTGGLYRASTDDAVIRDWWRRHPNALIGVPTGQKIGAFVVDLDPKGEPVEDVEARLLAAIGPLPHGPRSRTQSGGLHLWFRLPEGDLPRNSAKRIQNVDWRGDGGYVIAPPSVMSNGNAYEWLVSLDDADLPEAPPTLLDLVFQRGDFAPANRRGRAEGDALPARSGHRAEAETPGAKAVRHYARAALDRARDDVAGAAQGSRGHTLNAAAYGIAPFVGLDILSEREVYAALQDGADASGLTATDGTRERDEKIRRGLAANLGNTGHLAGRLDEIRREAEERATRYGGARLRPPPVAGPEDYGLSTPPVAREPDGENPPTPVAGGGDDGPPADGVDWKLVERCAAEPETDIGNGRRFLHAHRDKVIWISRIGPHVYDGVRWVEDVEGSQVRPLAHATVEAIRLETVFVKADPDEIAVIKAAEDCFERYRELVKMGKARTADDERERMQLEATVKAGGEMAAEIADRKARRARYGKSSGSSGKLDNMLKEASVYISRPVSAFDAAPLAINCLTGTLRLVRTEVEDLDCPDPDVVRTITSWAVRCDPHRREDLISKLVPVDYLPDATAPLFLAFLERVVPDPEIRAFLQRYLGYALTGLTTEQVFVFLYGQGRNGKSTLVDLICRILGEYAATVPFETLAGDDRRKGSEATPDLARLPAARLVRAAEPEQTMQFREAMVKSLTSGEPILVRRLHQDFIEIYPTFKLIVSGNHKPTIKGTDEGIWRRVLLVPFEVQIPKDEIDRALPEKLWAERAGVLNWLLEGLVHYLNDRDASGNGLRVPEAVRGATDEYREESDPIGAFLNGACLVTGLPADVMTPGELYGGFEVFARKQGIFLMNQTTFARHMSSKAKAFRAPGTGAQFEKRKSDGLSIYRGVVLNEDFRPSQPSHTRGGEREDG